MSKIYQFESDQLEDEQLGDVLLEDEQLDEDLEDEQLDEDPLEDFRSEDQGTCRLCLRNVSCWSSEVLYEAKALSGKPIYKLIDEMVRYWSENHPDSFRYRVKMTRQFAKAWSLSGGDMTLCEMLLLPPARRTN